MGAPLDLGERQQGCALDCQAGVPQNSEVVFLDCGEMKEGYSSGPLHPQDMVEDYAVAPGNPSVSENNGCLLIQTEFVQMVGLDLLVQDQLNCVEAL